MPARKCEILWTSFWCQEALIQRFRLFQYFRRDLNCGSSSMHRHGLRRRSSRAQSVSTSADISKKTRNYMNDSVKSWRKFSAITEITGNHWQKNFLSFSKRFAKGGEQRKVLVSIQELKCPFWGY